MNHKKAQQIITKTFKKYGVNDLVFDANETALSFSFNHLTTPCTEGYNFDIHGTILLKSAYCCFKVLLYQMYKKKGIELCHKYNSKELFARYYLDKDDCCIISLEQPYHEDSQLQDVLEFELSYMVSDVFKDFFEEAKGCFR